MVCSVVVGRAVVVVTVTVSYDPYDGILTDDIDSYPVVGNIVFLGIVIGILIIGFVMIGATHDFILSSQNSVNGQDFKKANPSRPHEKYWVLDSMHPKYSPAMVHGFSWVIKQSDETILFSQTQLYPPLCETHRPVIPHGLDRQ